MKEPESFWDWLQPTTQGKSLLSWLAVAGKVGKRMGTSAEACIWKSASGGELDAHWYGWSDTLHS